MVIAASYGMNPGDAAKLTPYELTLWFRGQTKNSYNQSVSAISVAHFNAVLQRSKKIGPLKTFLPKEPLTKVERRRKVWDSASGLAALGVGKVKVRKKKGKK